MFVSGYTQIEIVSGFLITYTVLTNAQSSMGLLELNLLFECGYRIKAMAEMDLVMVTVTLRERD